MKRTLIAGTDPITETNSHFTVSIWKNGMPYKMFRNQRRFRLWLWWQKIKGIEVICIIEL